ncbi:TIGR04211 family SH3 domain-containing protein [Desulfobotulus sp. H1]|uniref:TIGR04211 family SH3 domain-containing protein n=1 Tax=Desulfobotulus pelophilus TaxID=2823377 RepID=A0ABT3N5N9_9BACT|nr:TIGR04211 family SH3 domain-containing protein [Desulfobotulus pelophilus]MCW7752766.1 TIGR04211 family SH3 domain-containing protein [Desulfobotulus pelophilus]
MRDSHFFWIFFFLILTLPFSSMAGTAYVTDSLQISVRRGPTTEHRILRFIHSGHPVKILEENDGWSRIVTIERGDTAPVTGWVLARYLTRNLPLEVQNHQLAEDNERLRQQFDQTDKAWKESEEKIKILSDKLSVTRSELEQTRQDLDRLTEESSGYLTLRQKSSNLEKERDALLEENILLRAQSRNHTLLIGGVLVFSGMLTGFLWGRRQKRYSGRLL